MPWQWGYRGIIIHQSATQDTTPFFDWGLSNVSLPECITIHPCPKLIGIHYLLITSNYGSDWTPSWNFLP